jgi:DNA-binding NarL/FixJ family response regulator
MIILWRSGTTAFLAEVMPDVAVHSAGSAKEALHSLNQGLRPDIVLLDIWLNDGTGFDAMQSFKTVIPGARFIFMSAEATPEIVGRARALSACGFVGKHLDANAFTAAVRKVLAGDTSFHPMRPCPADRNRSAPPTAFPSRRPNSASRRARARCSRWCSKDCRTRSSPASWG